MPRPKADGTKARNKLKKKLTDITVKRLKPEAKMYRVWDTEAEGLHLEVHPTGAKSYKLYYRVNGRPRWYTVGNAKRFDLKTAREIVRRENARMALDKKLDVQGEKIKAQKAGTFAELAERYFTEYASKRNKSWKQPRALVNRYLIPSLGQRLVADIGRGDVRTIFRKITDDGAPVLANQVLAACGAIYTWAIRDEVVNVPGNPAHGVERNAVSSRERVLSDKEVPIIWRAFDDAGLFRSSALKLIYLTGQRPGEVQHMRWEHIEARWWTLPGQPDGSGWPGTKNKQSHDVFLSDAAMAVLDELDRQESGWVFPSRGHKCIGPLSTPMRDICEHHQIQPKATPHDLRRTFSTCVTGLGFTTDILNRITNHKEGGIATVYDRHSYRPELQQIAEAVGRKIMALVEGTDSNVLPMVR